MPAAAKYAVCTYKYVRYQAHCIIQFNRTGMRSTEFVIPSLKSTEFVIPSLKSTEFVIPSQSNTAGSLFNPTSKNQSET